MKNDKRWYVAWDSQRFGPYSQEELIERARNNKVDIGAYVFCEGMKNWEHIITHPVFSNAFSFIPPIPPDFESTQMESQVELQDKTVAPKNVKTPKTSKTYRRFSFIRFFFVVLFGVVGFTCALFTSGETAALFGVIVGTIFGLLLFRPFKKRVRKKHKKPKIDSDNHFSFSGFFGICLAVVGLIVSFIAYEPDQWKAIVVYSNGAETSSPYRFKSEQSCNTWRTNQLSMMGNMIKNNPNTQYVGIHTYRCTKFCFDKFGCTLASLK